MIDESHVKNYNDKFSKRFEIELVNTEAKKEYFDMSSSISVFKKQNIDEWNIVM